VAESWHIQFFESKNSVIIRGRGVRFESAAGQFLSAPIGEVFLGRYELPLSLGLK
jgi:hypothetical protein